MADLHLAAVQAVCWFVSGVLHDGDQCSDGDSFQGDLTGVTHCGACSSMPEVRRVWILCGSIPAHVIGVLLSMV